MLNALMRTVRVRPVLSYVVLTLLWSFFFWGLILTITPAGTLLEQPMKPAAFGLMMLGLIGPTFGALVCTRVIYGKGSIRALYGRLGLWRLGVWGLMIVIPLLINLVQLGAYGLTGGSAAINFGERLPMGLMFGVFAGILEEFGWRGFMQPHLQKRFSPFVSALIVGLVWGGIWHGFADYIGIPQEGATKLALILLLGPALLTAYAVMLAALYNKTRGSMLACVGFHFFISFSGLVFEIPFASDAERVTWALIGVGLAWAVALVIAFASGMFVKTTQPRPQPHGA
jgi:membrane protease YdiL (CAAX protease family)